MARQLAVAGPGTTMIIPCQRAGHGTSGHSSAAARKVADGRSRRRPQASARGSGTAWLLGLGAKLPALVDQRQLSDLDPAPASHQRVGLR
jgi:hypothetical protein